MINQLGNYGVIKSIFRERYVTWMIELQSSVTLEAKGTFVQENKCNDLREWYVYANR